MFKEHFECREAGIFHHIAIISDTHYGHIRAPWCSKPLKIHRGADDYITHTPTSLQKYLMACLDDFVEHVPKGSILIHNGDVIQGFRVPLWHRELVTADCADQVKAAVEGLRKLRAKCGKSYLIQGTPLHTMDMTDWEQQVADKLNMKLYPQLTLKVEGQVIQFVHGRSHVQKYKAGMIESEWFDSLKQAKREGRGPPDYIVRSHMHEYVPTYCGVITPCWQLPTDWAKRSGKSYITSLGGVILHVQPGIVDEQPVRYALPESEMRPVIIK